METKVSNVWIDDSYPYALCYQNSSNTAVPVELQSFRPDPEVTLKKNELYPAILFFETPNLTLEFLRKIKVFNNDNDNDNEYLTTFYRYR